MEKFAVITIKMKLWLLRASHCVIPAKAGIQIYRTLSLFQYFFQNGMRSKHNFGLTRGLFCRDSLDPRLRGDDKWGFNKKHELLRMMRRHPNPEIAKQAVSQLPWGHIIDLIQSKLQPTTPCHPRARKGLFFEEKQWLFLTRGSCLNRKDFRVKKCWNLLRKSSTSSPRMTNWEDNFLIPFIDNPNS